MYKRETGCITVQFVFTPLFASFIGLVMMTVYAKVIHNYSKCCAIFNFRPCRNPLLTVFGSIALESETDFKVQHEEETLPLVCYFATVKIFLG